MDDHSAFGEMRDRVQVILAEVKGGNEDCQLNGPWTRPQDENMHRVLFAVGGFPEETVREVARRLYEDRMFDDGRLAIRFFAIGVRRSSKKEVGPPVVQLLYDDILGFVYCRMRSYEFEKADHPQWDEMAHGLYSDAVGMSVENFVPRWKRLIGIREN